MSKRKEEPARKESEAERAIRVRAEKMTARVAESNRKAAEYQATLDPRDRAA